MSIQDIMSEKKTENVQSADSSASSDTESQSSEADNLLPSINEPDVSLDEMLSLACRQGKLDIVQLLLQSGAHVNHRNKAGNTPLLEACSQGHVSVANYLLENGSKIDAPTETTLDSALTWACTLGNTSIVDALLQKNADVEHRTKDGCTALMFACLAGHRDVAEKLLDANSEINVESESNKDSPLTFACWKGHYDVVELLLQRNANIEHRTKEGFSPLMFAALGGHSKVAHKLLQSNAQVNVPSGSNNDIPLTSACWKGHHNVVKLLLEYNSNIEHRTKDGCTPLMLAAREGHIYVAELLLKNNAEVNVPSGSENNIPLTLACWKGHWEVVQLLLDHNSDIEHRNKAGCTPLMLAAREGHNETTALLLERAQVNVPSGSNDDTPLTLACWKGHKSVVLLLLDSKSNIDHQTKTGCTPLMEATREGHKDVAEILLNHNADVELPDNYGQSPLFMACWKGHRDVAELLLVRNAYRDCRTKTGITPLFQACRENHISIVELLLQHGAGVNTPFPNSRENPLTLCAEKGHQELVQLLLSKGATLDCHTKKGYTPIFLSCKEGHLDICKILLKQGANVETPDVRGNTPIMAAFKNGHVSIVEWLIKLVHHLPSDELCHKILMSSVDDKDKEVIVQQRSKCLSIIQEMKKKRELLALRNAQNLVQELDDERDREEKKKKKKAEKRRDNKNKRKKIKDTDHHGNNIKNVDSAKINGINHVEDEFDDGDEEEKDNIAPTENRVKCGDEKPVTDVLKISGLPTMPESRTELLRNNHQNTRKITTSSNRKSDVIKSDNLINEIDRATKNQKNRQTTVSDEKLPLSNTFRTLDEKMAIGFTESSEDNGSRLAERSSPIEVMQLISNCLSFPSGMSNISRQLPKTSGVCTQSSSTSGPSRIAVSSQTEKTLTNSFLSTNSNQHRATAAANQRIHHHHHHNQQQQQPISSVAVTTFAQSTTTYSDPRMEVRNIAPPEVRQHNSTGWDEEIESTVTTTASTSRNSSFDEYRESDWKETSRTSKMVFFEMTVPNSYCGRVIGKGGKKINLITDDSGAQITIDKPPTNIVPANRVITIKGAPGNAEKARNLVTKALNTPSLSNQEIVNQPTLLVNCKTTSPLSDVVSSTSTIVSSQTSITTVPTPKKRVKPLPSSEVRPLISYSKVAKASSTIDELQKEIESKCKIGDTDEVTTVVDEENHHKDVEEIPVTKSHSIEFESSVAINDNDDDDEEGSVTSPLATTTATTPLPPTTIMAETTNADLVKVEKEEEQKETTHDPFRPDSYDSTFFFYDAYNLRKSSEPGTKSRNFPFAEETTGVKKDPWFNAPTNQLTDTSTLQDASISSLDRNRSISWTGQPKIDILPNTQNAGSRSLSTDQLDQGTDKQTVGTWARTSSTNDVDDEQVFTEELQWSSNKSQLDSTASSGGAANETCDISSSPTSSVSSSKVELTTYFDNDSGVGVGGSNPLDTTPTSLQSEIQPQYNEQAPYLETNLETQSWYQARSAYSAPSSPALIRNADHIHRSRGSSPRSCSIRSHPSMDGINNRPWPKSSKVDVDEPGWNISAFRNQTAKHAGTIRSPENNDSGLSSPRTNSSENHLKDRPPLPHVKSSEAVAKMNTTTDNESLVSTTPISKAWSVERFQDVRTLSDLMKQLALEKYTSKLEQNGIQLENIINLTERDLQAFDVPKGPRLKILKACEVIKGQNSISQQQPQQQQSVVQQPLHTSTVSSSNLQHSQQQSLLQQQQHQQHTEQQQQHPSHLQQPTQMSSHHMLQQKQHHQQHVPGFFSNVQTTLSSASFMQQQHQNHFAEQQQQQTSQQIASSAQKSAVQAQQQQQIYSPQYRFPDFLSYGPPPPIPHPSTMQQPGFNFVLANNQQQQYMQQQTSSAPTQHQTNPLMPGCDDFGPVTMPHSQHSMGPGPEQMQQGGQTLLSQAFMYPPDNQAFYYYHPTN